eukprot:6209140-Pleurochrysis_carterae.AAC.1
MYSKAISDFPISTYLAEHKFEGCFPSGHSLACNQPKNEKGLLHIYLSTKGLHDRTVLAGECAWSASVNYSASLASAVQATACQQPAIAKQMRMLKMRGNSAGGGAAHIVYGTWRRFRYNCSRQCIRCRSSCRGE